MAFNNYYPTGYQPAQMYYPQAQPAAQQTPQSLIWVQGEAGAKSYLVAPNSTVTLWDSEAQTIYIKSADATGMPSIRTLDYTIRGDIKDAKIAVDYATRDDLAALRQEIDALKKDLKKKGKDE